MSAWTFRRLEDYWDERVRAVDSAARHLERLTDGGRAQAEAAIARAVEDHVAALGAAGLLRAAVAAVRDLCEAACTTDRCDPFLEAYLAASAGTLLRLLGGRGQVVQLLIDNTWADQERPRELLPAWFTAAGFTHICPQRIAADWREPDEDGFPPEVIDDARLAAERAAEGAFAAGEHVAWVDAESVRSSFAAALARRGRPGIITVVCEHPLSDGIVWPPRGVDYAAPARAWRRADHPEARRFKLETTYAGNGEPLLGVIEAALGRMERRGLGALSDLERLRLHQLMGAVDPEEHLRVARRVRRAGGASPDAGFHCIAWALSRIAEAQIGGRPYPEPLEGLSLAMERIEREHGLEPDELWTLDQAPADWLAFNDAWDTAHDRIHEAVMRVHDEIAMADLQRADDEEFLRRWGVGLAFFWPAEGD